MEEKDDNIIEAEKWFFMEIKRPIAKRWTRKAKIRRIWKKPENG